ncbi:MAG: protein translocase subunit SecD [Actinomycetota bacterium]|nr:protein translocase subunit SecD [Actinomycetota bacterium]
MKRSRGLWVSVIAVVVLIAVSVAAFAAGRLSPVLGLDLKGGVSVILSAPDGTPAATMEQALENIRNRVDAFGVGEPDIALSGTTIEIQIPGLSDSKVEQRTVDLHCITDPKGATYGCASAVQTPTTALRGFSVDSKDAKVCVFAQETQLTCADSQAAADAAKAGITAEPKASPTPSGSVSTSASASASPSSTEGPGGKTGEYCLTDFSGTELQCYPDYATAQAAYKSLTTEVTQTTWCIKPPQADKASATPTPTATPKPKNKDSATPTPSATPDPSKDPAAASALLDTTGSSTLPCDFKTEAEANDALAALAVQHITTRFCVVSAQSEDLGCFSTEEAASERQRETGQERLLQLIGKTARLEERPTLEIIPPTDPTFSSITPTCQTPEEQDSKACEGGAQDQNEVYYPDQSGNLVHLAPVVITGANITSATATLSGSSQSLAEWTVAFVLDGPGSEAFANATREAVNQQPPRNQIAIAVDHKIISDPVVQSAITAGRGEITGNFTEQDAKDLASILNAGSLPVNLTQQSIRTVSPTLGSESLKEGIIAASAGLVLLFLYLLFYYRLLGVVAWFGMSIWAVLAIALISLAGKSFGYALSLAGVAGLVISLGVTADSYIVFFERLKDEVRAGRSVRTAVQPAFHRAFRTIVAADIVTGIAAAVLYFTAVSSVRGFALTLGVATALDLFVVYFFKRPTVFLIARSKRLSGLRGFGLASATGADHIEQPEATR